MRSLAVFLVFSAGTLLLLPVLAVLAQDAAPGEKDSDGPSVAASADRSEPADDPPTPGALPVRGIVTSLTIFVLAIFVGFEVITKVPPTLHTPLMSGSNAISGITVVGALLVAGTAAVPGASWAARLGPLVGLLAVVLATVNVVGGFLVTHRMLSMFQRKK